jgi:hypothetical protein
MQNSRNLQYVLIDSIEDVVLSHSISKVSRPNVIALGVSREDLCFDVV